MRRVAAFAACGAAAMALAGCGGSALKSPAPQPNQPVTHSAGLRPGLAGVGVESVEYLAEAGTQARVMASAARSEDGQLVLRCEVTGSVTDLLVRLPETDAAQVMLAPELQGRFIVLAVQDGPLLDIAVSGLRKAEAREVQSCVDDRGMEEVLRDRWTLSGNTVVCRISNEPGVARDDKGGACTAVYRRASTVGTIQPVAGVQVRLVDAQYEVGWPAYLLGDYDQNGEVSLSDIVPLAMLFGLRPGGPGSLTLPDAVKRVDGSRDGEINLGDITTIAQNFKNTNLSFRVERSSGDASGPGADWESVGTAQRSAMTKTGEAVTGVSRAAYQRLRDAIAPGWEYYRVVALSDDAPEAAPSEAVPAPDGTPPAFSGDVGLTSDYDPVDGYVFSFNQSATDDRGGPLTWAMQLSGGGDPDAVPIMWEFTDGTSLYPVVSPFVMLLADGSELWLVQDEQYYVRLRIADGGGNSTFSEWHGFPAEYGTATSSAFNIDEDSLVLWVNRQGTVRFTPPLSGVFRGLSPQIRIYAKSVPWYTNPNDYNDVSEYAGVTPIEYTSGEVTLPDMLHAGEALFIYIYYEGWGGSGSDIFRSVQYPYYWLAPFSDGTDTGGGTITDVFAAHYLSDGTAYQWIVGGGAQYLALYRGGSVRIYPLEGIDFNTIDNFDYMLPAIEDTGEIVLSGTPSREDDEKSVYWWSPQSGVTSHVAIPTGIFYSNIGRQDTLYEWQELDKDTLLAVRSQVKTPGDGTEVIEVWQAERGGGVSLRTTYPVPTDAPRMESGSVLYLDQIGNGGELVIHERWSSGPLGPADEYYHVIDPSGNWSTGDLNVMPASSDAWASWPKVYAKFFAVAKDLTAYGTVYAFADASLMEHGDTYTGLFRGQAVNGLQSFAPVVAFCTQAGMPNTIMSLNVSMWQLIPPFDGTAVWTERTAGVGRWTYLTDGQGRVVGKYGAEDDLGGMECDFFKLYTYHTRQGLMPGLANALLSDDGEWLAVGKEGAYGIAYWNTSQ